MKTQKPPKTKNLVKTQDQTNIASLRMIVRGTYQIQKQRIAMGNRIVGAFKRDLGQEPGKKEKEELDKESLKLLEQLRRDYKSITEGVVTISKKKFKPQGLITDFTQLVLLEQYMGMEEQEKNHFKRFGPLLEDIPIWTEFLKGVGGCGPALSGIIISEIDIHKAEYPSSLWKYAGLDVAEDGKGRSKRKEHLVEREYTAADGHIEKKNSITFNNRLKAKLCGILGPSFLRCGGVDSPYAKAYYEYKNRLENHPMYRSVFFIGKTKEELKAAGDLFELTKKELAEKDFHGPFFSEEVAKAYAKQKRIRLSVLKEEEEDETMDDIDPVEEVVEETPATKGRPQYVLLNVGNTKLHRHRMAIRYSVKRFLVDLYKAWRALEGLPVAPEYSEVVLNMPHKQAVEGKGRRKLA